MIKILLKKYLKQSHIRAVRYSLMRARDVFASLLVPIARIFLKVPDSFTGSGILILAEFADTGGTRQYLEQMMWALRKTARSVYLVICSANRLNHVENLKGLEAVEVIEFEYNFSNFLPAILSLARMKALVKKKHIGQIIASEGSNGLFLPIVLLSANTILIEHTIPWEPLPLWRAMLLKQAAGITNTIISVSNAEKAGIERMWKVESRKKNDNVHHELLLNSGSFPTQREIRKSKKYKKHVLNVGHVVDYKNPKEWIRVAEVIVKRHSEIDFIWIGDGPLLAEYSKCLSKGVSFVGAVDHDDLASVYQESWLFLSLSQKESFGISVADAGNFGVPSIVSDISCFLEIIETGQNGFFARNADEAATIIESLLLDESKYCAVAESAQEIYKKRFSIERWEKEFLALVEKGFAVE